MSESEVVNVYHIDLSPAQQEDQRVVELREEIRLLRGSPLQWLARIPVLAAKEAQVRWIATMAMACSPDTVRIAARMEWAKLLELVALGLAEDSLLTHESGTRFRRVVLDRCGWRKLPGESLLDCRIRVARRLLDIHRRGYSEAA